MRIIADVNYSLQALLKDECRNHPHSPKATLLFGENLRSWKPWYTRITWVQLGIPMAKPLGKLSAMQSRWLRSRREKETRSLQVAETSKYALKVSTN